MAFKHTACFVITVMIICNAVLYPSIFSTMFRQWFGMTKGEQKEEENTYDLPPHLRHSGRGSGAARPRTSPNAGPQRTPEGAGFFKGGSQGGGDRGRGLMGSILPVYAVGILMYFAYIMYKIFLKDKKPEEQSSPTSRPLTGTTLNDFQAQYGPTPERREAEELQRALSEELKGVKKQATAEIKKAKAKASTGETGEVDVAALQKRLEDTEQAMQRMMDMMNNMGVAMNQVTKQLCVDNKDEEDPGQQADDEVSDEGGEQLPSILHGPISTPSTDTEESVDIENIHVTDRVPSGDEFDLGDGDDNGQDNNDEEEVVEDIGRDDKEEDGNEDTVRRRHVGSTDGDDVQ